MSMSGLSGGVNSDDLGLENRSWGVANDDHDSGAAASITPFGKCIDAIEDFEGHGPVPSPRRDLSCLDNPLGHDLGSSMQPLFCQDPRVLKLRHDPGDVALADLKNVRNLLLGLSAGL